MQGEIVTAETSAHRSQTTQLLNAQTRTPPPRETQNQNTPKDPPLREPRTPKLGIQPICLGEEDGQQSRDIVQRPDHRRRVIRVPAEPLRGGPAARCVRRDGPPRKVQDQESHKRGEGDGLAIVEPVAQRSVDQGSLDGTA